MNTFLLVAHVLTSVLFIGPVTVASSMFPRFAKQPPETTDSAAANPAILKVLHSITRVYGVLGLLVPVFGFLLAYSRGIVGEVWILASIILTGAAALILALLVYPQQRAMLENLGEASLLRKLRISSGVFALLWVIVVVLMVVQPRF